MNSLARAFVLFRIPKLSELRQTKGVKGYKQIPAHEVANIKFRDKHREKQRQANLLRMSLEGKKNNKKESSKKKVLEKEGTKRKMDKKESENVIRRRKKKGRQKQIYEEWDDLAKEERLAKKLRKGQITQKEYAQLLEE
mmetsp:Transcript_35411/g.43731  ORF Transcript_35411/g.43731 Transcript_35411/m.43731 type:complete len:139 (-) Transcript_35411:2117-2533(-)